jgi:hypothetical protein
MRLPRANQTPRLRCAVPSNHLNRKKGLEIHCLVFYNIFDIQN